MISLGKFLTNHLEAPVFSYNTSPRTSSIKLSSAPSVTFMIPCSTAYRSTRIILRLFVYRVQSVMLPGSTVVIYSVSCERINCSPASLSSRNINSTHKYAYSSFESKTSIPINFSGTTGIFSIFTSRELSMIWHPSLSVEYFLISPTASLIL